MLLTKLTIQFFGIALCLISLFTQSAFGDIVFISDGASVGRVDTDTGTVLDFKPFPTIVDFGGPLGPFNEGGFTDIAVSPSGQMYGISPQALWTFDYDLGTNTRIAQINGQQNAAGQFTLVGIPNSLTFGTDGTLYIAAANTTVLHTMDETTATVTSLDNSQLGGGSDGDLAFIGSDLFMSGTNGLHRFDLTTTPPNGVTIGNTGLANLFGLATPDQSTLFGIAGTSIYSIDPTDASSTFLSNYGGQGLFAATGSAFATESVPEPSTFALLSSALMALMCRRTKRCNGAAENTSE